MLVLVAAAIGAVLGVIGNYPWRDPYESERPKSPSTPTQFTLECVSTNGSGCQKKNRFNGFYYVAATYYKELSDGTVLYSPLGRVSVQKLKSNSWNQIVLVDDATVPSGVDGIAYYLGSKSGYFYLMSEYASGNLPQSGANIWNKSTWRASRKPGATKNMRMTYKSNKFGFNWKWAAIPALFAVAIVCMGLTVYHYILR